MELVAATEKNASQVAVAHAGNAFVTRDLDLWSFDPKINGFPDSKNRGTFFVK